MTGRAPDWEGSREGDLTHVGPGGEARMVDVSGKKDSERLARATGLIRMAPETLDAIMSNALAKGDVLAVARVAGVMAAKKTAELIPLCHPIPIDAIDLSISADVDIPGLRVEASVRTIGRTGVEMEAITAVSVTLVTVYDMAKSLDRGMVITDIRLLEKSGGTGGYWRGR